MIHLLDINALLPLAVKHRARLATFDRHIDPAQIPGGETALFVINAAS